MLMMQISVTVRIGAQRVGGVDDKMKIISPVHIYLMLIATHGQRKAHT